MKTWRKYFSFRDCVDILKNIQVYLYRLNPDARKAVDQMEGFLKSVDQNVDQAPLKATEG
jgi:hypothetical protein